MSGEQGNVECDGSWSCPAETHILGCFRSKAEAPVSTEQAWEDMRAYNIRLEERAREAERALAEALRERDELLGSVLAAIIELNSWLPSHSSEALRGTLAEAAAALRPSEDTSDES